VIPALDGADDDARAGRIEEGDRGRLVASRALVGVVAHERGLRDGGVDPAVDARKSRRDLVDRAMKVVDARLQGDGEVDEVMLPAAEEDELRCANRAQLPPCRKGERRR